MNGGPLISSAVIPALAAALLFGVSTPFAKLLGVHIPPVLLAGLLYLGSGVGLWLLRLMRDRGFKAATLSSSDWRWLISAIISGGILAPILLMYGLRHTTAGSGSLLLNLEGVFTALLAWVAFREHTDRRIVTGMTLIIAGGVLLTWTQGGTGHDVLLGQAAVTLACFCWALDNNLTRRVSASDAVFIAATKGLVAGITNLLLALALGESLPGWPLVAASMGIGLLGYGLSLVLFVVALRALGAARTGAYFSTAPFIGAAVAVWVLHEPAQWPFWLAAALMAVGVWLHLTERHEHVHTHDALSHSHSHRHDEHHQHSHDPGQDPHEPHTHEHQHVPLRHSHPHYPDLHHRHGH